MATEERPVCPACDEPLKCDLAACCCNRVFHRVCLSEIGDKCTQCSEAGSAAKLLPSSLTLFGVCFEGNSSSSTDPRLSPEIVKLRGTIQSQKKSLVELKSRLLDATVSEQKQRTKLEHAQRQHTKREDEVSRLRSEIEKGESKHVSLTAEADSVRDREAIFDYLEKMKESDDTAKAYLVRWADMSKDPAPILAEIGRIRAYHRDCVTRRLHEIASKDKNLAKARLEQEKRQQSLSEVQKKLKRSSSSSGILRPRPPRLTLATSKRPRLTDENSQPDVDYGDDIATKAASIAKLIAI